MTLAGNSWSQKMHRWAKCMLRKPWALLFKMSSSKNTSEERKIGKLIPSWRKPCRDYPDRITNYWKKREFKGKNKSNTQAWFGICNKYLKNKMVGRHLIINFLFGLNSETGSVSSFLPLDVYVDGLSWEGSHHQETQKLILHCLLMEHELLQKWKTFSSFFLVSISEQ